MISARVINIDSVLLDEYAETDVRKDFLNLGGLLSPRKLKKNQVKEGRIKRPNWGTWTLVSEQWRVFLCLIIDAICLDGNSSNKKCLT